MTATGYPGAGWSFPPPQRRTLRSVAHAVFLVFATFAGRTVRVGLVSAPYAVKFGPGLAGASLVVYGVGSIYRPAGFIIAGLAFLLIDRRV